MAGRGARWLLLATLTAFVVCAPIGYYLASLVRPHRGGGNVESEGGPFAVPDPGLGYAPAPDTDLVRHHRSSGLRYRVSTDARGARVDAPGVETPNDVGLLAVGGSYAWGHGVENRETFTSLLGGRLGTPTANLAFAGFGTAHAVLQVERNADLAPEWVVYAFTRDHLRRNLAPCSAATLPFCIGQAHVAFDARGAPRLAPPDMLYFERIARDFQRDVVDGPAGIGDVLWGARIAWYRLTHRALLRAEADADATEAGMRFLMQRLGAAAARAGARLAVLHVPSLAPGWHDPPPLALLRALPRGTVFVDASSAVMRHHRAPQAASLTLEGDAHPSPAAHHLLADELEAALRRENGS